MRLRRFYFASSSAEGWRRIAGDDRYELERCGADGAGQWLRVPDAAPALFRIRTRSAPSLVVATAVTLPEVLQDWTGLCGLDVSNAPFSPDRATMAKAKGRIRLSPEQIATFVQMGAALSRLRYAVRGPGWGACGALLLLYAYGKGLLTPVLLLWLLCTLFRNRFAPPGLAAAIQANHAHNLNVAAQWAGKCSSVLEALLAVVTSPNPVISHVPLLLFTGLAGYVCYLVQDPAWHDTLMAYSPIAFAGVTYCIVIWGLGELAPHVVPSLGWPDPLHLLLYGIRPSPIPRTQSSLDWDLAIPVAPLDWEALIAQASAAPPPEATAAAAEPQRAAEEVPDADVGPPPSSAVPDNLPDLLAEVDRLANTGREAPRCLSLLEQARERHPDSAEVLWRFCRTYDEMFVAETVAKKKEALAKKGAELALRAVQLEPLSAAAHRWKGIMLGRSVDFMGVKEKVATGVMVREAFEKALELDPNGGYCVFCMASWYLAVAELSWVERKAARMIFNDFPENPYQDALALFQRAAELNDPKFVVPIQNLVSLAKCHIALKQKDKAKEVLQKVAGMAASRPDELQAKDDAAKLLRSC